MSGHTLGPHAPPVLSTGGAISPGHVLGLAAKLLSPRGGAPQSGAGGHVGTGGGPRAKYQLTLSIRVEILSSKLVFLLFLDFYEIFSWIIPHTVPKTIAEIFIFKLDI